MDRFAEATLSQDQRETLENKASEMVDNAMSWLVRNPNMVFYGAIALKMKRVPSWERRTMSTNGRDLFFNPAWTCERCMAEVKGVIVHEILHCALLHQFRRGKRHPRQWNYAADYAINWIIAEEETEAVGSRRHRGRQYRRYTGNMVGKFEGIALPPNVLYNTQFADQTAEEIFHKLFDGENQPSMTPPPAKPEQGQGDGGDGEEQDQNSDNGDKNQNQGEGNDQTATPGNTGDNGQDEDGKQDGSDNPQGDGQEPPSEGADIPDDGGSGSSSGTPDQGDDVDGNSGNGSGNADAEEDPEPNGDGGSGFGNDEPEDGDDGEDDWPWMDPTCEGWGEVEDYPDPESVDEAEADARQTIREAMNTAKAAGSMPAGLERMVREGLKAKVNWREILAQYFDHNARVDYAWTRPNRRHGGGDFILPSLQTGELDGIAIAFDTSGSMSDAELDQGWAEASQILSMAGVDEVDVLWYDTKVYAQRVSTKHAGCPVPKGGGGTDVRPVFDYYRTTAMEQPKVLIFITDGDFNSWPSHVPDFDTIWCLTVRSHWFEEMFKSYGFGTICHMDMS